MLTLLAAFLAQADQSFTIAEGIRQGGLVAVIFILVVILKVLLGMYLKKDKSVADTIRLHQTREDTERQRLEDKYEKILKDRDDALKASADKFEELSEKFREQIKALALDQQKFTGDLTTVVEKMTDEWRDELRSMTQALLALRRNAND
jgi:uncharacterized protein HemX